MPIVSLLTPTFNRRPFIPNLIQMVRELDYPKHKMEWVIIDDGTDSVEDLFKDKTLIKDKKLPRIRYFRSNTKMTLGRKRNMLNNLSIGEYLVCIDDDDYYPPERVKHAVNKLKSNPLILCGGCSEIYCWFNKEQAMYVFGPYNRNHGIANTFAYKRKLLERTSFHNDQCVSEEKFFLKDYTLPFIQFDPLKTVIQIAHNQNSFDKNTLSLNYETNPYVRKTSYKPRKIIKNIDLREFYTSAKLIQTLADYTPGDIRYKTDIVEELSKRKSQIDNTDNKIT